MIASHTIPAFYLKQFSTRIPPERTDFIYVYEKGNDVARRNIRRQGKEKGYFAVLQDDGSLKDETSERAIAALENECNEALFCSRSELFDWSSSASRRKLAFYASLLYARATQRRAHSELVGRRVHSDLIECTEDTKLMEEIANQINSAAQPEVFTADSAKQLVLNLVKKRNSPAEVNSHFVSALRSLVDYFSSLLLRKTWQVWRVTEGAEFVTSDNPVINFIPLPHGPFHPGHGFNKGMTAFPLAPDACLIMGISPGQSESRRVDKATVSRINDAIISICDKYVYSKTLFPDIHHAVQGHAGDFKYGTNALMPVGIKLPSARDFLRRQFGLPAEND